MAQRVFAWNFGGEIALRLASQGLCKSQIHNPQKRVEFNGLRLPPNPNSSQAFLTTPPNELVEGGQEAEFGVGREKEGKKGNEIDLRKRIGGTETETGKKTQKVKVRGANLLRLFKAKELPQETCE